MSDTLTLAREARAAAPGIARLIERELAPRVTAIDLDGEYPEAFLRALGGLGGFAGVVAPEYGGSGKGVVDTITTMAQVGEICLSTAFTIWCQTACARYLQLSDNRAIKTELLPGLASGSQLGGTGLSNTFKSCCEIERFLLDRQARQRRLRNQRYAALGFQSGRRPCLRDRLPGQR